MTTSTTASPTYGLAHPSVADLRTCVTCASGGDPHLWGRLCRAAGVREDADGPAALTALIAVALEIASGPVRVAVMSLNVRVRAHAALTALAG
ncbi:hypothetical protein GCM10010168_71800 [Actinoplanes ianthinogenes]|uniref:Uncharacterized protein n=1 Tax=Actinoplanes ianthinogenes TaxID=122358 RepID=A0ABN6CPV2_9ACTN|nr:hypothetical protein [Actinoplanes ianthinogenes]BCJ47231.1 hypothetical protein Aiant_78880 [Actinoplanes ianthinogenes]GGR42573.1 hypothetical protein GCM10010168_71800 [Actinoplanes ianthinogenes]